jgi:hypothetical protein
MPPRYAYWTILVDEQPTAFRSSSQDELMPTFKRLKAKNPSAKMMWWQNGKLWASRLDAQEAMRARGEMGRKGDDRQAAGFRARDRKPPDQRHDSGRLAWKPKSASLAPRDHLARGSFGTGGKPEWTPKSVGKPDWKPKGAGKPEWEPKSGGKPEWRPKGGGKPEWKSKAGGKPEWKPKAGGKPEWKPKSAGKPDWKPKVGGTPEWRPKPSKFAAAGREPRRSTKPEGRLEWRPKGPPGTSRAPRPAPDDPKRKWVPKEEYKKSLGIEARKDKNWRPGGDHKDPRQKYKDAKKAKWGRFKQNIRQKWEGKQGARKKRDE